MRSLKFFFIFFLICGLSACQEKKNTDEPKNQNQAMDTKKPNNLSYWVGTYTIDHGWVNGKADGILKLNINLDSLELSTVSVANDQSDDPSFLHKTLDNQFIYATQERSSNKKDPSDLVVSYKIEADSLVKINQQETNGHAPCHVSANKDNTMLIVSNYFGENLLVYPINADGSIGALKQEIKFHGKTDHFRQEESHIHSATFNPDYSEVWVCDLGGDTVTAYKVKDDLTLDEENAKQYQLKKYTGPRSLVFHPTKPMAYVTGELSKEVVAIDFSSESLTNISYTPSIDLSIESTMADVHINKEGTQLYVSNRGGVNSISIFTIDPKNQTLKEKIMEVPTRGKTPRNFTLNEEHKLLIIGNQDDSNVVIYRLGEDLLPLDVEKYTTVQIDTPTCLIQI